MRVLIVEDDFLIAKNLRTLVQLRFEGIYTVHIAPTLKEARQAVSDFLPDVVVTDILLPDGNGLDLVRLVAAKSPHIFCVCMSGLPPEQIISSIAHPRIVRFLPKPFHEEAFYIALHEALNAVREERERAFALCATELTLAALALKSQEQAREIEKLSAASILPKREGQDGITLRRTKDGKEEIELVTISAHDIVYVQGLNNQSILVTRQGECLKIAKTLRALEIELPAEMFIRTDRSFLVNIAYIQTIGADSILLRFASTIIPIARRRRAFVKKQVQGLQYVAGGGVISQITTFR